MSDSDFDLSETETDTDTDTTESVDQKQEQPTQSATKGADEQYCSSCGETIKKEAEVCPECGVRQQSGSSEEKNPGLALLLSFVITGAGQIYNGQVGKGIALIVLQAVNFVLLFFVIGLLTFPLTWGYGVYDAYTTAQKINSGKVQV